MYFSRKIFKNVQKNITLLKRHYAKSEHPFKRTVRTLNDEIREGFNPVKTYPEHADVVIIGGGFIGSSAAYWLKNRAGEGLSVVVVEKDTKYEMCNNIQSHGNISQHFSLPENINLSQFSNEFLRNIRTHLGKDIDIQFCPHGTLILASEKYADKLEQNVQMQQELGVKNKLLTAEEIQRAYPWINTSDIKVGCLSTETEGSFNPQELLRGLILKSQDLGAKYLKSEVVGFEMDVLQDMLMEGVSPGTFKKINKLIYRNDENEEISLKFAVCVVAAGAESAHIAKLANIGVGDGLLSLPLPVGKRDYNVYSIENPASKLSVGLNTPYIMDTSGLWLRKNGIHNNFICGQIPSIREDKNISADDILHSSLNNRYPALQNSEIKTISKEYFDCNNYDDTGIIGPHPYHTNVIFASGFSKQGVYHAPGIGRAVAELIIDCQYITTDLTRLGFDRILMDEPLIETNMY